MQLPGDILERLPEEGARRVALALLGDAAAAADRLSDPDDPEALHDFRVAVRRLRSAVRAYRSILGDAVRKKDRQRLRGLQEATGGGRDAEVFLAWIQAQRSALTGAQQPGAGWLTERLGARKAAAMTGIRDAVVDDFRRIEARLRERLAILQVSLRLDTSADARPRFGDAVAAIVRDHAHELRERAEAVAGPDDEEAAHATRIAGKRLRYLLEPFAPMDRGAKDLVKRGKRLQTVLGDLHDVHVFGRGLGDAVEEAAAEQARRLHAMTLENGDDPAAIRRVQRRSDRTGLLALTRRARAQADALHESFHRGWREGGMDALVADVEALATRLERRGRADVEIERKLLLRSLPAEARTGVPVEIHQGWLPGDRLQERIRKAIEPDGRVTYTRTVKLGKGLTRTELEEETDARLFDALWQLTEGCRVCKRRWKVEANGHLFEIDEFLDRDLVLAEVELEDEDQRVDLPGWLEDVVDRDVTGEPDYVNLNLAS